MPSCRVKVVPMSRSPNPARLSRTQTRSGSYFAYINLSLSGDLKH